MSTIKQAEAVARIFRNKGKSYDFNEIWDWDGRNIFSPRASGIIGASYASYQIYEKVKEEMKNGRER